MPNNELSLVGGSANIPVSDLQNIVNDYIKMKNIQFSNHDQRLIHFILYLNTEIDDCTWSKDDPTLNFQQYIYGKPINRNVYCKLVDILKLYVYVIEMVMSTPYCFNRDLVDIILNKIKYLNGIPQLLGSTDLIIALIKSVKRLPIHSSLENQLNNHFNRIMLVFYKDNVPDDMKRLDYESEQKLLMLYNGFRVKSILKILIELIKFQKNPNMYIICPVYELKSLNSSKSPTDIGSKMFNHFLSVIMQKCINMCNFSINTWLSWYEIEVIEDDTNLQALIGHMCFDLCTLIDNGSINEDILKQFRPILNNMAIEKIDLTNVDTNNIDGMIDCVENCSKLHLNNWIKKMIENLDVFTYSRAIQTLDNFIESIDCNCFKRLIDRFIIYHKNGGILLESLGKVIHKGIMHMDLDDKINILKHIMTKYPDNMFYLTNEFDNKLKYVAYNENEESADQNELMSTLIWLVFQQPQKMFHLLISQYVCGIYGLPVRTSVSKKSCLHKVLMFMHIGIEINYIYLEYSNWLDLKSKVPANQNKNLYNWIVSAIKELLILKPTIFLAKVMAPLLVPSQNYKHMLFLINVTNFVFNECQLMSLPDIDIWDTLVIQLGKIMDDARWTIETYSTTRVKICENIILCLQPLLHFACCIAKPTELENIKKQLSGLHLLNRCHFLCLWTSEYITVEGMDEQFIMTIQSQSHISYSNLNRSSNQGVQEEFIFSIATYLPKLTTYEMKSFVANYLSSAKAENITDASFFLMDCVMNAFMRIIVYLKTAVQNDPYNDECAWDYLTNTIVKFIDTVQASRMCCIYRDDLANNYVNIAYNTVTKIIMVIKQMKHTRQLPLLIVIQRIIYVIVSRLDVESISKCLSLLAPIRLVNSKETLINTIEKLIEKLNASSQNVP